MPYLSGNSSAYHHTEAIKLELIDLCEVVHALPLASAAAESPSETDRDMLREYLAARGNPNRDIDDVLEAVRIENNEHFNRVGGTLLYPVSTSGVGGRNLILLYEYLTERFAWFVNRGARIRGRIQADDTEDRQLFQSWDLIISLFDSLYQVCKSRLVWMVDTTGQVDEVDELANATTSHVVIGENS